MGASATHSYLYNRNQLKKLPATNHDDDDDDDDGGSLMTLSLSVQKRSELGSILTKPNQMKRNERNEKTEPHFGYINNWKKLLLGNLHFDEQQTKLGWFFVLSCSGFGAGEK